MPEIRANLILKSERGLFKLATIKETTDNTVIVTMPKLLEISEKAKIDPNNGKPLIVSTSPVSVSNIHASYHSKTGFKHIKIITDKGEGRVFTENAKFEDISDGYLQHLLRIFPTLPEKHPPITKRMSGKNIIIDIAQFDNKPIGIIISVTDREPKDIRIAAPQKSKCAYTKLNKNSSITLVSPARQNDILLENWPENTWWFSPYK
jgi:hypothetical protein